jgi:flagellin-like protein
MRYNKLNKKGVSPVIATVLLIALVVIIALIVFLWFRSITQEAIVKFGDQNVELVCEDVQFIATYNSATGTLSVSNTGNVPIYSMNVKISKTGEYKTEDISEMDIGWPTIGLRQGGSFSGTLEVSNPIQITLIPVLLGTTKQGTEETHVCADRYGYDLL